MSVRLFLNQALERLGYRCLLTHGCLLGALLLAVMSASGIDQPSSVSNGPRLWPGADQFGNLLLFEHTGVFRTQR
ncbi:hypothetical protein CWS02_04275 [Enterobacter sp. EA-1]|nr:hypothetical protein CWS02_04275 [Enterobacter sp. EA-1]